jgi:GNAT superfamily N-acetyltransferase
VAIEVVDQPDPADVEFLHDRLYEFNVAATGFDDGRSLTFLWRQGGVIVAGLHGWTWGATGWIDVLWVAEALRSRGVGSQLLGAAEAEARSRGCAQIALSTHTFQARGFYEHHGFEVTGYLDNHPHGHGQHTMRKRLT